MKRTLGREQPDARDIELDAETFHLCVVGAGPVGLAVALEAAERGLRVLLIEAGSERNPQPGRIGEIEKAKPVRHAALSVAMATGLGGTSKIWGGRCVAFDPIDFASRDYVANSSWPVSAESVIRYYPQAANFLGCGEATFSDVKEAWFDTPAVSSRNLERWARVIDAYRINKDRLARARNLTLREGHRVIDLSFEGQRLSAIEVSAAGRRYRVRAHLFVLACGGIGTTRLLLAHQRDEPLAFGGKEGALGRYYMGHISGKIATLVLSSPEDVHHLDFFQTSDRTHVRRRLTVGYETQLQRCLLNAAFWLDNPPFYDAGHDNAVLSSVYLALAMPVIGRRILPEAVRLSHLGKEPDYKRHLQNIMAAPHHVIGGVIEIVRDRYLSPTRKPGFLIHNVGGRYALHYHAEQSPSVGSHIGLLGGEGSDGLPLLSICLRYSRIDAESVVESHAIIDQALRKSGRGQLEYWHPATGLEDSVLQQAADGIHQLGTTRMSASPTAGVVDANLRVHGTNNLFIASTSVFPTSGQANPTFLAVALAIRLGRFLVQECSSAAFIRA
jgi:choline dehydrogenase-like flavoprotein